MPARWIFFLKRRNAESMDSSSPKRISATERFHLLRLIRHWANHCLNQLTLLLYTGQTVRYALSLAVEFSSGVGAVDVILALLPVLRSLPNRNGVTLFLESGEVRSQRQCISC